MLQPSVVEPVSDDLLRLGADEAGEHGAGLLAQLEHPLEVLLAEAAVGEIGVELLLHGRGGRARERAECPCVQIREPLEHREERTSLLGRHPILISTGAWSDSTAPLCRRRSSGQTSSGPCSTPAATMWSMFGARQVGIAQVEVAGEHSWLPGAAMVSTSAWARVSSARGTSTCLNSFVACTFPTTTPLEPDGVTDPPLAALVADPDRAVLERDELRREQDRVRLPGDAGAEAQRVVAAGERRRATAARSVRFATALRTVIPLQLVELRRATRAAAPAGRRRPARPREASSTISRRCTCCPGGEVRPWKTFQLRTSTGTRPRH